jgi:hypothetical protein
MYRSARLPATPAGDSQDEKRRARSNNGTNAESRFARHYESLANQAAAQWLEALDDGIWNQLRRGEVVE